MTRSLACFFAVALSCGALAASVRAADVVFQLTEAKGTPIADAVVSLIPLDAPVKITPPAEPLEIAQSGQEFLAYVTPVAVGTTVVFPNHDTVAHQVYSLSPAKKFTFPLYKPGTEGTETFDRPREDELKIQDEIAGKVSAALAMTIR